MTSIFDVTTAITKKIFRKQTMTTPASAVEERAYRYAANILGLNLSTIEASLSAKHNGTATPYEIKVLDRFHDIKAAYVQAFRDCAGHVDAEMQDYEEGGECWKVLNDLKQRMEGSK